jgi:GNAT superfamily N-acetyltransferase
MRLIVRPLTPELWPAFADLFGEHGACNGCWCMYWRIGNSYTRRPRDANRAAFHRIVKNGPPPGLLAFDGDRAVGWCQLTPRRELAWLDGAKRTRRVDELPVWSLSCFYVRSGCRRKGVSTALIQAALRAARRARAPALEAYPMDAPRSFTGLISTFEKAGFRTAGQHAPHRPIMRHDLKGIRGAWRPEGAAYPPPARARARRKIRRSSS